jgi:hypothetical protein
MINNDQKTSLLIPSQLPSFIRDEESYATFVAFIQAYYEFLELPNSSNSAISTAGSSEQGPTYASKNLTSYSDVDSTLSDFLNYFVNDFLPYFPEDALLDKATAVKVAKQLYQTKGTPAAYQFLFRILYNSDFDYFNTGDVVLKASAGSWYVPRSLRLATDDIRFLNISGYRAFGETSKTIATIETSVLAENKTEVFISNIERLFNSGEMIRIVDNNNQDLIINGTNLRAKLVGQISQINIAKDILGNALRGLFYNPGDPVIVYGGLNPTVTNPIGATAEVGTVTTGSLQAINTVNGGYGYSVSPGTPLANAVDYSVVEFFNLNAGAKTPIAVVETLDSANGANATQVVTDSIQLASGWTIGNTYYFSNGTTLGISTANTYQSNYVIYQGTSPSVNTFIAQVGNVDLTNNIIYLKSSNNYGKITNTYPLYTSNDYSVHANVNFFVVNYTANDLTTVATSGQTLFTTPSYDLRYDIVKVFANSSPTTNFSYTSNTSITLNFYVGAGTSVDVRVYYPANTAIYYTPSSYQAGETVYQGANLASATYFATIQSQPSTNVLKISGQGPIPGVSAPTFGANLIGATSNTITKAVSLKTSNAQSTLANTFTFVNFATYPISSVYVENQGGGISTLPTVYVDSQYASQNPVSPGHLKSLGILAPIQILNPGLGYSTGNTIVITGGRGQGANAVITSVNSGGAIMNVSYVYSTTSNSLIKYPLGGLGYTPESIPTVTIASRTGQANAILSIPGIFGDGFQYSLTTDRTGSITTIDILNYGEDYDAQPNVSMRVQDIVVTGTTPTSLPARLSTAYQGANVNSATYIALVDSTSILQSYANNQQDLYSLRVFNYNASPNTQQQIKFANTTLAVSMVGNDYPANYFYPGSQAFSKGLKIYGDGNAQGTAQFLDGLTIGEGQYLTTAGQPSSFDVLQSSKYNNFTYQITVEKEIAKYRDIILNLLHPSGMNVIGRYAIKSNNQFFSTAENALDTGLSLYHYTGTAAANATMTSTFSQYANNIVTFNNLSGANIATFIFSNSVVYLAPTNGPAITSSVNSIDYANNQITLTSNTWLTFGNVAYAYANAATNIINITQLTGNYNIINNGVYSNTAYPLYDIVFAGDRVQLGSNVYTVTGVNYTLGQIGITPSTVGATENTLLSVARTYGAGGTNQTANQVIIYGPVGLGYIPSITTESGDILTDEQGNLLLLG